MKNISNAPIKRLFEWLVIFYIIFSPSYNVVDNFKIFGLNIIVINSLLLVIVGTAIAFLQVRLKTKNTYHTNLILIVFILEVCVGLFFGYRPENGLLICMLLFWVWFNMDIHCLNIKRLYIAFYVSTIVAAFFSITLGFSDGVINRVATKIDGSIAVIAIAIVCFADHSKIKSFIYDVLKNAAFISAFVVAGFGMSRARIAIILVIVAFWIIKTVFNFTHSREVVSAKVLLAPVLTLLIILIWNLPVVQNVLQQNLTRFEDGFKSLGRAEEIVFGIELFKKNFIFGAGWSEIEYVDYLNAQTNYVGHCMYVALLARGGLLFGIPFLAFVVSLIKEWLRYRKNLLLFVLVAVFFALGYGNAGMFNYTISGCIFLLSWHLKNEHDISCNINEIGEKHEKQNG